MASRAGARNFCDSESQKLPRFSFFFTLLQLTTEPTLPNPPISVSSGGRRSMRCTAGEFRGREFSGETESFLGGRGGFWMGMREGYRYNRMKKHRLGYCAFDQYISSSPHLILQRICLHSQFDPLLPSKPLPSAKINPNSRPDGPSLTGAEGVPEGETLQAFLSGIESAVVSLDKNRTG